MEPVLYGYGVCSCVLEGCGFCSYRAEPYDCLALVLAESLRGLEAEGSGVHPERTEFGGAWTVGKQVGFSGSRGLEGVKKYE